MGKGRNPRHHGPQRLGQEHAGQGRSPDIRATRPPAVRCSSGARTCSTWSPTNAPSAGVFMAFQYPVEVPGVSIANFLRTALQARLDDDEELDLFDFQERLVERMELLDMEPGVRAAAGQ